MSSRSWGRPVRFVAPANTTMLNIRDGHATHNRGARHGRSGIGSSAVTACINEARAKMRFLACQVRQVFLTCAIRDTPPVLVWHVHPLPTA